MRKFKFRHLRVKKKVWVRLSANYCSFRRIFRKLEAKDLGVQPSLGHRLVKLGRDDKIGLYRVIN